MKSLVFDTGTVISLIMNNTLWVLEALKKKFDGEFYIGSIIKYELVDRPIKGKKFKFEAIMIEDFIKRGILKVYDKDLKASTNKIMGLANKVFSTSDGFLKLFHDGEMEGLALVKELKANALLIDERSTRMVIENPKNMKDMLTRKLHTKVWINKDNLKLFLREIGMVNVLRSSELLILAYERGLMDKYISSHEDEYELVEGMLWGTKLRGCSISVDEIYDIIRLEGLKK